jgi:hypothetical protein
MKCWYLLHQSLLHINKCRICLDFVSPQLCNLSVYSSVFNIYGMGLQCVLHLKFPGWSSTCANAWSGCLLISIYICKRFLHRLVLLRVLWSPSLLCLPMNQQVVSHFVSPGTTWRIGIQRYWWCFQRSLIVSDHLLRKVIKLVGGLPLSHFWSCHISFFFSLDH